MIDATSATFDVDLGVYVVTASVKEQALVVGRSTGTVQTYMDRTRDAGLGEVVGRRRLIHPDAVAGASCPPPRQQPLEATPRPGARRAGHHASTGGGVAVSEAVAALVELWISQVDAGDEHSAALTAASIERMASHAAGRAIPALTRPETAPARSEAASTRVPRVDQDQDQTSLGSGLASESRDPVAHVQLDDADILALIAPLGIEFNHDRYVRALRPYAEQVVRDAVAGVLANPRVTKPAAVFLMNAEQGQDWFDPTWRPVTERSTPGQAVPDQPSVPRYADFEPEAWATRTPPDEAERAAAAEHLGQARANLGRR